SASGAPLWGSESGAPAVAKMYGASSGGKESRARFPTGIPRIPYSTLIARAATCGQSPTQESPMYHRIIVPLDGTPFSEYAIPYGARIAERAGATLELCHVHVHHDRNPDFAALTPYQFQHCVEAEYAFDAEHEERESEYLNGVAERVRGQTAAVVTTRMLSGRVEGALRHEAESSVADLLVMATHARSG